METSFLLRPLKKSQEVEDEIKARSKRHESKKARKKRKIANSDSESESSEEDFFFLEKLLKETNELDEVDQRLLMGIV